MHRFTPRWIIHLQIVFVCILCSEENVSRTAANSLLDRKCTVSLMGFEWVTHTLPLCVWGVYIYSLCSSQVAFVLLPIQAFQDLPGCICLITELYLNWFTPCYTSHPHTLMSALLTSIESVLVICCSVVSLWLLFTFTLFLCGKSLLVTFILLD